MATLQLNAQDPNFWIFLCFGQSNMAGQAPIEEQDLNVSDRYLSMATTDGPDRELGTWRKAVPPLCRADAHLGPADWFGRTLIDVVPENVRIGIVSVAVEGCPITFFDKDQNAPLIAKEERDWMNDILDQYGRDPYERLLAMAKIAAKDGVIKGILLHQGETDAYNDQWQKTLRKIYRDLQQELSFDSTAVPLFVGEVVRGEYGGICGHANPTINDIANHYPNTYVVSSEGCLPSDDNLHFSGEGYRLLGRHYALRYLEVTNPQLAEVCRQKLAAAGLDKGGTVSSKIMMFKDKVAVVTGGAKGIGRCIVEEFQKAGAQVCVIDKAAWSRLGEAKQEEIHFVGDIADKQTLEQFAQEVIEKYGHIDYLINNALPIMKGIDECSYEEFLYAMNVGVTAPFYLTKLFAPHFADGAAIVNISSSRDRMSQPQTESYTAAKGGIAALTHALAVSLAGRVRVNSVSPGWIDTNYTIYEGPDAIQQPVGRVGNPLDIANMVLYLCSDKAGFITGENICIDGGMTRQMIYHGDNGWKLDI